MSTGSKVKLPKLELPEEWTSFYQRFETATRGKDYDDSDRFQYLLASLKNGADTKLAKNSKMTYQRKKKIKISTNYIRIQILLILFGARNKNCHHHFAIRLFIYIFQPKFQ